MRINYSHKEIIEICYGKPLLAAHNGNVHVIYYDSRKISLGTQAIFVCIKTKNRDGHLYMEEAYKKGVRTFLVDKTVALNSFPEATIIQVSDVLVALQKWAKKHREQFDIPVIGITGSVGKTVVKEWLNYVLSDNFSIARSPKSYNSQMGVALSLFEIDMDTEIAIIEAGISEKGEMMMLEEIIQPTIGVFTSFLSAHRENFTSTEEHLDEKLKLFQSCKIIFAPKSLESLGIEGLPVHFTKKIETAVNRNIDLIRDIAEYLKVPAEKIDEKLKSLPQIAMRMETIEGINDNILLFDAFNLNFDGLEQALSHQLGTSGKRYRYVVLSEIAFERFNKSEFDILLKRLKLVQLKLHINDLIVFGTNEITDILKLENASILFKGLHPSLKRLASQMKFRKHSTYVEISISALKDNLVIWRKRVPPKVGIMAMVKASSYGSELTKMGEFLNSQHIDYLGVAYVDEGVELRKSGLELAIMVMNSDRSSWSDCIKYNLEPSVYSFVQMEELVSELILMDIQDFPIHLKFDTGMHRLGFFPNDISKVVSYLKSQPEIKVKSVYSHLADADNLGDNSYTLEQMTKFQFVSETLQKNLPYPVLRHILNTEGLSNFPEYGFDMVRIGIGLYGVSSNPAIAKKLTPVLSWKSTVSQIKTLRVGESVGYSRSFIANVETKIATIPVGYADGFKRILGKGNGGVFIGDNHCLTIGNVCMDMIMVDITNLDIEVGDEVEIIGPNQSVHVLAEKCGTISYEIMTSLSARMPRIFVQEED